ncbi:FkbM family methyltransferase [Candidatus Gracilibacteria bacterium]|nr:FkbM family methyltransferase [Candidatus Gracilibacteria bacterium]
MYTTQKNPNLIYDVGMHTGEDTEFYLKKGFQVVAFEANPELIQNAKEKFAEEIKNKQLIIVEGAIVDISQYKNKTVKFFRNKDSSVWGTVMENWAERNEKLGTENEIIEVPVVDFVECLQEYEIPHYLKIDIEGCDMVCLESLLPFENKPDYVSIESDIVSFKGLENEFNIFKQLGYNSFKAINQLDVKNQKEPKTFFEGKYLHWNFPFGSSGLFGLDLPGDWKTEEQILKQYKKIFIRYDYFGNNSKLKKYWITNKILKVIGKFFPKIPYSWYDTHARHDSVK